MRTALEVADIFRAAGPAYRAAHAGHLSLDQLKVMSAIETCRTAIMGGHIEACTDCGHWRVAYNSCRNRHCPRCQGAARRAPGLAEREADLLPVGYFHVVFTLPAEVADIALQNKAAVYGLLFQAASETMTTIAADPRHLGARIGITAVLHTWGSAMTHHPHIHMIVPGGGLSPDGSRWMASRPAFLLPVRVLGKLFRRLFLTRLTALHEAGQLAFYGSLAHLADRRAFLRHLAPVRKKRWVVYAKPPFAGPETVLAYLSRYTHRVAISNSRLLRFDESGVTFRYKDYRRAGADRQQTMTIAAEEFMRRFLLHVLPKGFHRIRHYGLLAGATRKARLDHVRQLLGVAPPAAADAPDDPARCPATMPMLRRTHGRHRGPSNAGDSPAHRRTAPRRPGLPRHDPAWLGLIPIRRSSCASGDDAARANDAANRAAAPFMPRFWATSMPNTAPGGHLPARQCLSRPLSRAPRNRAKPEKPIARRPGPRLPALEDIVHLPVPDILHSCGR